MRRIHPHTLAKNLGRPVELYLRDDVSDTLGSDGEMPQDCYAGLLMHEKCIGFYVAMKDGNQQFLEDRDVIKVMGGDGKWGRLRRVYLP